MNNKIIPEKISSKQEVDTGLALSFLFILIGIFSENFLFYKLSGLSILLTMLIPKMYKPIAYMWFGIANVLGFVISKVLLFIVYALIIVPIALVRKAFGKDNLKLKEFKTDTISVFFNKDHTFTKTDIEKPF